MERNVKGNKTFYLEEDLAALNLYGITVVP